MPSTVGAAAFPAENTPVPPRAIIADIQTLRAVAIALVLVEHSWWNLLTGQPWLTTLLNRAPLWCGVDLFFVVSGFVITRRLLPAMLAAPFASGSSRLLFLVRFWGRRAFRIWPAAWLWLALMMAGSLVMRDPAVFGDVPVNAASSLAGVFGYADFRFGLRPLQPYGPSYPYWSLSLEEQFYLLLPLLIMVTRRWLALAAGMLILVQLPLAHPRLYFFLRSEGLLWGVLLAGSPLLAGRGAAVAARIARIPMTGWVVLVGSVLAMSQLAAPREAAPPFELGCIAEVGALLVWLAAADRDLFHAGPLQPAVMWLGSRSYALYLCHVPIFQCASELSRQLMFRHPIPGTSVDALSTLLALIGLATAAEGTYRLVERPLRDVGVRLTRTAPEYPARLEADVGP